MGGRRYAVLTQRHATRGGNFYRDFRCRQYSAMAGLGTLRELDLYHFHLRRLRLLGEFVGIETTSRRAAAKIAGTNFPDQITAMLTVIRRDGTLTRIVSKATELRAAVECTYGIR